MTAINGYSGDVPFDCGGKVLTLRYDWAALAAIKTKFKDQHAFELIENNDLDIIAEVAAIGLQCHHKGMTAKDVIALSPPVMLFGRALVQALNFAYWGPTGEPPESVLAEVEQEADPIPPEQSKTESNTVSGKRSKRG